MGLTKENILPEQHKKINVLIVEDSAVVREYLKHILESDPKLHVMGMAEDGEEAVNFVSDNKPDVITMDVNMPDMNGLAATRKIMEINPVPIIIVSASFSHRDVERSFKAIQAGAIAVVEKPPGPGNPRYEHTASELIQTVKLMSEVKVVKRWNKSKIISTLVSTAKPHPHPNPLPEGEGIEGDPCYSLPFKGRDRVGMGSSPVPHNDIKLIAIGASTGGPPVLLRVLSGLHAGFPVPILIVQHIAMGFLRGLVEWLGNNIELPVVIASDGERIKPGTIYFAPEDLHLGVDKGKRISLSDASPENGIRPSVSYLFRSAFNAYGGSAAGILLTGMGRDGAEELCLMRYSGALTIAQDKESSVVHGMPGEAIRLGGAAQVLPPERIAALLEKIGREA
ncbi:MAG: chemotaxis-specific protein-glutamate methyltransferase CheB [Nitrospirae bacterium]|nr:chemotaxis-specific protein-glutamate methyltransferase CheB [Nitrospirota bacterium]